MSIFFNDDDPLGIKATAKRHADEERWRLESRTKAQDDLAALLMKAEGLDELSTDSKVYQWLRSIALSLISMNTLLRHPLSHAELELAGLRFIQAELERILEENDLPYRDKNYYRDLFFRVTHTNPSFSRNTSREVLISSLLGAGMILGGLVLGAVGIMGSILFALAAPPLSASVIGALMLALPGMFGVAAMILSVYAGIEFIASKITEVNQLKNDLDDSMTSLQKTSPQIFSISYESGEILKDQPLVKELTHLQEKQKVLLETQQEQISASDQHLMELKQEQESESSTWEKSLHENQRNLSTLRTKLDERCITHSKDKPFMNALNRERTYLEEIMLNHHYAIDSTEQASIPNAEYDQINKERLINLIHQRIASFDTEMTRSEQIHDEKLQKTEQEITEETQRHNNLQERISILQGTQMGVGQHLRLFPTRIAKATEQLKAMKEEEARVEHAANELMIGLPR